MAEANWNIMGGSLTSGNVKRGVTAGVDKPSGGGNYVYGFNSVNASPGSVALYTSQASFVPTAKGGSVRAAVRRGPSASPSGCSCYVFIGAQGASTADNGYMLGLSDSDPSALMLRKGLISAGIVDGDIGDSGILAKSTATWAEGTWLHIRLDQIVNPSGDVVLRVYMNDLDVNAVNSPLWEAVEGLTAAAEGAAFIDDSLGINSGSSPFAAGYIGYGFQVSGLSRRAFIDHVAISRQT